MRLRVDGSGAVDLSSRRPRTGQDPSDPDCGDVVPCNECLGLADNDCIVAAGWDPGNLVDSAE